MKKQLLGLAIATAFMFAAAPASAMTKEEYKAAKDKIEADYKAEKAQCGTMKDNAKDVCEKQAKGKENVAKAELEQQYKPSESHQRKVAEEKMKADYEVAKEKCDDQKGDAKDACQKQAKAEYDKGRADMRTTKKM